MLTAWTTIGSNGTRTKTIGNFFSDGTVISPVYQKELNFVEYSADSSHHSVPIFVTVRINQQTINDVTLPDENKWTLMSRVNSTRQRF